MTWNLPAIKVVIVDDEALAREKLLEFLSAEENVEIVGVCASGIDAVGCIEQRGPDLLFLDIQMSTFDGFSVLEALRSNHVERLPITIFTTAHDQYAIQAFENHALDYLLKPFSRDRFRKSLQRAREHLQTNLSGEVGLKVASLLSAFKPAPRFLQRLVFKSNGRFVFLKAKEIRWIGAEGNYLRIHTANGSHLLRETMGRMEEKLDPEMFLRVHRSTMVNVSYIKELQPWFNNGESTVVLVDGTKLALSRGYRSRIDELVSG